MDFSRCLALARARHAADGPPPDLAERADGRPWHLEEARVFRPDEDICVRLHPPSSVQPPLFQPHSHDFFEVVYVHQGAYVQVIGGQRLDQRPDQIVVLRPYASHCAWAEDEADQVINLLFRRSAVERTVLRLMSPQNPLYPFFVWSERRHWPGPDHLVLTATDEARAIAQRLVAEYYDNRAGAAFALRAHAALLLTELARAGQVRTAPAPAHLVDDMLAFIAGHAADVTQKAVAEHFRYSPRHVSRLLTQATGQSFASLVHGYRLDQVCQAVDDGVTVAEAARAMGYCDAAHFYRVFKRERGVAYREYRRARGQAPPA
jgi:AraC-like DNA-binding protein/mannose-6-phosphate isomerase-like protein (cupin superfamily)